SFILSFSFKENFPDLILLKILPKLNATPWSTVELTLGINREILVSSIIFISGMTASERGSAAGYGSTFCRYAEIMESLN
ncbi:MAG: hypothetical protein SVV67_10515, partial [Bacillota bacterium]|nr:hypothetical protein [Bacillota bacterium]